MANIKITDLTAYGDPTSTDVLPIVDVGADVTKKVSIQDLLKNAGSGTAAAPGIAFDGDSDTGIYRPGEDQLAISTNGTGRLFVDASGNVSIGTSAPGALFHTVNTSAGAATLGAFIQNANSTANTEVRLGFSPNSSPISDNRYAYIGSINVLGSTDNSLTFGTGAGEPATERMRIDSSGNVGIGTTNVDELLHVESDGATPKIKVESTLADSSPGFRVTNDARSYDIRIDGTNDNLQFYDATASQGRVAIDSSGRLLVGTSSDSGGALLQVNGDRIRVATAKTPASATATGTAGEICWDADYIYVCTATNTWKRAALATW